MSDWEWWGQGFRWRLDPRRVLTVPAKGSRIARVTMNDPRVAAINCPYDLPGYHQSNDCIMLPLKVCRGWLRWGSIPNVLDGWTGYCPPKLDSKANKNSRWYCGAEDLTGCYGNTCVYHNDTTGLLGTTSLCGQQVSGPADDWLSQWQLVWCPDFELYDDCVSKIMHWQTATNWYAYVGVFSGIWPLVVGADNIPLPISISMYISPKTELSDLPVPESCAELPVTIPNQSLVASFDVPGCAELPGMMKLHFPLCAEMGRGGDIYKVEMTVPDATRALIGEEPNNWIVSVHSSQGGYSDLQAYGGETPMWMGRSIVPLAICAPVVVCGNCDKLPLVWMTGASTCDGFPILETDCVRNSGESNPEGCTFNQGIVREDGRNENAYFYYHQDGDPDEFWARAQIQVSGGSPVMNCYLVWDSDFGDPGSRKLTRSEIEAFCQDAQPITLTGGRTRCYIGGDTVCYSTGTASFVIQPGRLSEWE